MNFLTLYNIIGYIFCLFLHLGIFIIRVRSVLTTQDDETQYSGFFLSSEMPFPRSDMRAATFALDFGDDKGERIYLVGGCVEDQLCAYNNATEPSQGISCYCPKITNACTYFIISDESWHFCAPAPRNRYRHFSAIINNKLYVAGGRDVVTSPFDLDNIIYEIDEYDPLTDTWTTPYNWTTAVSDGAAFGVGNLLYLVGGYDYYYSVTAGNVTTLNVVTGEWDYSLPRMHIGRGDIAVATPDNIRFYIVGGWIAPIFCNASNAVEIFDTNTNQWTIEPYMIYSRGDCAAQVAGENVFAIAGETKAKDDPTCTKSVPVPYVSRYSFNTMKWEVEASIPEDVFRYTSGTSYNHTTTRQIFLFGGQGLFREETMSYPLKNSTLKYVPLASDFQSSSSSSNDKLSDGGIAGITIGVFFFVVLLVVAVITYGIYRRKGYLATPSIELSHQHVTFTIDDVHDEETGKITE